MLGILRLNTESPGSMLSIPRFNAEPSGLLKVSALRFSVFRFSVLRFRSRANWAEQGAIRHEDMSIFIYKIFAQARGYIREWRHCGAATGPRGRTGEAP